MHPPDNTPDTGPLGTPVAFFVFNRPDYTLKVLEVIRQARPKTLFLIADGPRRDHPGEAARCLETRRLLGTQIDWPCTVYRDYADMNLGCRERIASGLKRVFEQADRAIILEDDCLPEPTFFRYCDELLERYRDDPRIGMLSGTNYRLDDPSSTGSYFFARHHSIWGWATWRRAFKGYDPAMNSWRDSIHPTGLAGYWEDRRSQLVHRAMFDLYRDGAIDTWDIPWVFHLVTNRMLSVVPHVNQVSNIGVTGMRGRGGDRNNNLPTGLLPFPLHHPKAVEPDPNYDRFVSKRHRLVRDWVRARWSHHLRNLFSKS